MLDTLLRLQRDVRIKHLLHMLHIPTRRATSSHPADIVPACDGSRLGAELFSMSSPPPVRLSRGRVSFAPHIWSVNGRPMLQVLYNASALQACYRAAADRLPCRRS